MLDETKDSNLHNNEVEKVKNTSEKSENKISSKSTSAAASSIADESKTDKAVEDIMKQESDELLDSSTPKVTSSKPSRFKKLLKNKRFLVPAIIVVLIAIALAVPVSRYKIFGLLLKENYALTVTDSQTGNPVTDATINLAGKTATTDGKGRASLKPRVGYATITITKKYYKTFSEKVLVGLHQKAVANFKLQATGRQVPIKVVNVISGQAVANAEISADGTSIKTDNNGQATIVLPANDSTAKATIKAVGYNDGSATIKITSQAVDSNTYKLTPNGLIYFLSNASGKIDVVKANLDGTGRQTVLAGTGSEDQHDTVLLASRDWKYLALLSKRNGGQYASLFLINTATDELSSIEASASTLNLVGWDNHSFVYTSDPAGVASWKPGQHVIKSYNADTGKLITLDQTTASGSQTSYANQDFGYGGPYIVSNNKIIYVKQWETANYDFLSYPPQTYQNQILSINADGTSKQVLKSLSIKPTDLNNYYYINSIAYNPDTIYFQVSNSNNYGTPSNAYYFYQSANNSVSLSNVLSDNIYNQYSENPITYLESPNGKQTFWTEERDGKNTLFVGDASGANGKNIASQSDYAPYGWYGDNYLLVQKSDSELYIMPVSELATGQSPLKISNYYKPAVNYAGYGSGYGGL